MNPQTKGKEKWEEYEDEVLKALIEHYGIESSPSIPLRIFDHKNRKECQNRWNELVDQEKRKKLELSNPEPIDTSELFSFKPTGLDQIPLLPFLEICRYLDYQDVYGSLSKVCKHFYALTKNHQIFLEKIQLEVDSSIATVLMLRKKVWGCHKLIVRAPAWKTGPFHDQVLVKLLDKMKPTVTHFICTTRKQSHITEFINNAPRLRILDLRSYDMINEWNWNLHRKHHNIRELIFGSWVPSSSLEEIIGKVPQIERITWNDQPAEELSSKQTTRAINPHSKLQYYKGSYITPLKHLWPVRELNLSVTTAEALQQLNEIIPHLRFLETLTIHFSDRVFAHIEELSPDNCMNQFLESLKCNNSLRYLAIERAPRFSGRNREVYDMEVESLLSELPMSIVYIRYKQVVIRY
jgi:hypothetical protein